MEDKYLNLDYSIVKEHKKDILEFIWEKLNIIVQKEVPKDIAKVVFVVTSNSFKKSKTIAKKKLLDLLKKESIVNELMRWLETDFLEKFKEYCKIGNNIIDTMNEENNELNLLDNEIDNDIDNEMNLKDNEENLIHLNKREKPNIFNRITKKNNEKIEHKEKEITDTMKEIEEKNLKKKRCTFWPKCKNEECKFVHPKEECKKFPNCIFKKECIYIHPIINCKFGLACQNKNCNFIHPKMNQMFSMFQKMMENKNYNENKNFKNNYKNNYKKK